MIKSPYYRTLQTMGCRVERLPYKLQGRSVFRIITPEGHHWLSGGNASYPFSSERSFAIATDKIAIYDIADSQGICTPRMVVLSEEGGIREAVEFAEKESWNVIVKPSDAFDAAGFTGSVGSQEELKAAILFAANHANDGRVIVQQKIALEEYRFTVFRGEVISVLRRRKMRFIGDGVTTLGELLERENEYRAEVNMRYGLEVGPLLTERLIGVIDPTRVLADGEVMVVGKSDKVLEAGALLEEVGDSVDASYKQLATRVATSIGANLIAVDMFIDDITVPARAGGYYLNEVNTSPASFYYLAARGRDDSWIVDVLARETIKLIDGAGKNE